VRAGLQLLEGHESALEESEPEELRRLIAEADGDIAAGRVYRYASAEELMADIIAEGEKLIAKGGKLDSGEGADHLASSKR
jgi:hypothetical protein